MTKLKKGDVCTLVGLVAEKARNGKEVTLKSDEITILGGGKGFKTSITDEVSRKPWIVQGKNLKLKQSAAAKIKSMIS